MLKAMTTVSIIAMVYSSGSCPVVVIETANGPVRINESDYDPDVHVLIEQPVVEQPVVLAPVSPGVVQEGAKWYIVDMNNDNVRIGDEKGYVSKAKATAAAQKLI